MAEICRSFTIYNYHIPVDPTIKKRFTYITTGFWDGMDTESIINTENSFDGLWENNKKLIFQNQGDYSLTTIYGFGNDDWFSLKDRDFWDSNTEEQLPLIFVIFIQVGAYKENIENVCKSFKNEIEKVLDKNSSKVYVYITIDKNDLIVCIRSKTYSVIYTALHQLHNTQKIIYSYTFFSISENVLNNLGNYSYLKEEKIDSICIKGVINTFNLDNKTTLNSKIYKYGNLLIDRLYDETKNGNGGERRTDTEDEKGKESDRNASKKAELDKNQNDVNGDEHGPEQKVGHGIKDAIIYENLGDNDFRLIAKDVNLWYLLHEMGNDGLLNPRNIDAQFYLFSFTLVLNLLTKECDDITEETISITQDIILNTFQAKNCKILEERAKKLIGKKSNISEELLYSILQLTKSLQAMERAPITKYEFYSLYKPLSILLNILEEKDKENKLNSICSNDETYILINKMNMTLHGSLRSDIQFLQTQDFNVIGQYIPARIRAFYSLWMNEISDFYNSFTDKDNDSDKKKEYVFLFAPGFSPYIGVRQFIMDYKSQYRLLVANAPEKALYNYKTVLLNLVHEVSHTVGSYLRNREFRFEIYLEICTRVFALEYKKFVINKIDNFVEKNFSSAYLYDSPYDIEAELLKYMNSNKLQLFDKNEVDETKFHSKNLRYLISNIFGETGKYEIGCFFPKDIMRLSKEYIKNCNKKTDGEILILYDSFKNIISECEGFYGKFISDGLLSVISITTHIMTESYADLIAILTLHISPYDYLLSFTQIDDDYKNEKNQSDVQDDEFFLSETESSNKNSESDLPDDTNSNNTLYARIFSVISCVKSYIKKYDLEDISFTKSWTDFNINIELINDNDNITILRENLNTFFHNKENLLNSINHYTPMFEYNESFTNRELDFLNDSRIQQYIQSYLSKCADSFQTNLNDQKSISDMREKIESYFNAITPNSMISFIQLMETFFDKYEKKRSL